MAADSPVIIRQTPLGEADLLRRLRAGEGEACSELVASYRDRIYARAYQILRNHQDAEEVTQDTFIRAQRSIDRFRGESALFTWLYQIVTNLSHNRCSYWWRRRRDVSISLDQPLTDDAGDSGLLHEVLPDATEGPREEVLRQELATSIEDCLPRLSRKHREILHLRLHRNLAYEEIADILGISVGTVKSRLARARVVLREALGSEFAAE